MQIIYTSIEDMFLFPALLYICIDNALFDVSQMQWRLGKLMTWSS